MTEAHSSEVEKVLLFISDAQERAGRTAKTLQKDGADDHIVAALYDAEARLGEMHRRLMQRTYYAAPVVVQQLAI